MRSSKGLLIAVVLLAVLGGLVCWSNKQKAAEEAKPKTETAATKIVAIPADQITQITLQKKAGEPIVLKKSAPGKWDMVEPKPYRVDSDAVASLTGTLNPLNAGEVVEQKAANLGAFGLETPALRVTVTKKDGSSQTLLIGDDTPTGGDAYAKLASDPKIYTVSTTARTSLDKTAQDLRDKRLLTFDSDKLTRVQLNAKNQTVEFGKNNQNEWQILEPRPLRADGWQVEELIRKLRDARMDSEATPAQFASGTPVATAKVTDNSGTQTIEVSKNKDDYYAKSSATDGVYKVASDLGTGLDKGLDDFRNKKLFDFGFNEPSKIEIQSNGQTTAYAKSADKWYNGTKPMDSAKIQSYIDKLRDLSATKFVDTAFGTPTAEITVTLSDGKRTEKVQIAKQGNDYLAKRENEPSVYQLDPKAAEEVLK